MKKGKLKFAVKFIVFSLPILLLLGVYLIFDPFKVLHHYVSYYENNKPLCIYLDRDYVSTETFINNSEKTLYDTFIFGSSRSFLYRADSLKHRIKANECFHFNASGETLLGVARKIKFLDSRNVSISNALIILDHDILDQIKEREGHIFKSHPLLSKEDSFTFQLEFFKTYLTPKFLLAYSDFLISGKVKKYMIKNRMMGDEVVDYKLINNELRLSSLDSSIMSKPFEYYNKEKLAFFYKRDTIQHSSPEIIKVDQLNLLNQINDVFLRHKTRVKIVINPLYDQLKLNKADLLILQNIFGEKCIYDFSGINFITNDYRNYYEPLHYRPHISDYITNDIYK